MGDQRTASSHQMKEYKLRFSQIFSDKQMPWPISLWNDMRPVYSMGSTEGKASMLIAKTEFGRLSLKHLE